MEDIFQTAFSPAPFSYSLFCTHIIGKVIKHLLWSAIYPKFWWDHNSRLVLFGLSDIRSGSIHYFALSCPELLLSDKWCHSGVEDISSVSLSHSLVKSQSYVANLMSRCLLFLLCHFVFFVFVLHRLLEDASGTSHMVAALCLCLLFAAFLCIFCLCLADLVGRGCWLGCCCSGRPSARWNLGRGAPSHCGRLSFNFIQKSQFQLEIRNLSRPAQVHWE